MKHVESKKFSFNRPPTGTDITQLIKDNELYGYRMDIRSRIAPTQYAISGFSTDIYDVIFERDID